MAKVSALLDTAGHVARAPDLSGLNLRAAQWQSFPERIKELVAKGLRWQRIRAEHGPSLLPQAWNTDLRQVRQVLNTTGRSFFGRLFSSSYRRARRQLAALLTGELPSHVDRQIKLLDAISAEQQLRAELGDGESGSKSPVAVALGARWAGYATDWDAVAPVVHWWLELQDEVSVGRVSPDVVRALQSRTNANRDVSQFPSPGRGQGVELARTTDKVTSTLDAYLNSAGDLLSALDIADKVRSSNSGGLIALPFSEQQSVLGEWAGRLTEIQDIIGFNNGADAALREGLGPVVSHRGAASRRRSVPNRLVRAGLVREHR